MPSSSTQGRRGDSPEEKSGKRAQDRSLEGANCCEQAGEDTPLMQAFVQQFD